MDVSGCYLIHTTLQGRIPTSAVCHIYKFFQNTLPLHHSLETILDLEKITGHVEHLMVNDTYFTYVPIVVELYVLVCTYILII